MAGKFINTQQKATVNSLVDGFKQKLNNLENIAGSMPVLDKQLTGHEDIRKINVRNYIIKKFLIEKKIFKNRGD